MKDTVVATASQEVRYRGTVYTLKTLRGYGFLLDFETRRTVFFPFSKMVDGIVPRVGDIVSYELAYDREGRSLAYNIRIETAEGGAL
jgi:hypothetical protein